MFDKLIDRIADRVSAKLDARRTFTITNTEPGICTSKGLGPAAQAGIADMLNVIRLVPPAAN